MTSESPSPFLNALRAWADKRPDALAVLDGGETTTYRNCVARIDRRAEELRRAGLRAHDRVAVVADNSTDYLVSAFAVWAAGGTLVTVYPSSGQADLTYCLDSSEPALVLAEERVLAIVAAAAGPDVPVADVRAALPAEVTCRRASTQDATPEELALVCYTSGSTSRPKAVMHSHAGLFAAASAYAQVWHIDQHDRTIVCLPMAWAFGLVTTSMATLAVGGTVLPLARTKPALIIEAITSDRATFLAGVTTTFRKMVDHLRGLADQPDLSSLRLCISGGEPRNEKVFAEWTTLSSCPVHDVFAASECFPVVTYDPIDDPHPVAGSAGKVVAGARMRLIDPATGQDVPPGASGEALWQGPAHFLGYWRDPEATANATTADGWYRTRDLVRVDEHGYVFVEGRLSDMIIRGGSNVSPAEVEQVVCAHPDVHDAAVVGVSDPDYGQAVVAVLVAETDARVDAEELAGWCRSQLASYKVPTRFVTVEALPVNHSTGKVDRRKIATSIENLAGAS
ncbi:class I adenylate-forming enzyme family protein [Saccharopolyspora pogona]|uniref:class I adenylate-forming enzyme family protein n=1 Tax=Saccharopolyspora pogona TaxID=333966 RepID=UPI0016829986|nr:class I adenylate-forming enzyme family protein [Saccharopolyspora pogona]